MNRKGFTLLELLMVVIIIGILATVAMPQYQKFRDKAIDAEAFQMLGAIARAEELYYMLHGVYLTVGLNDTEAWNKLGMENPNTNDNHKFLYLTLTFTSFMVPYFSADAYRKDPENPSKLPASPYFYNYNNMQKDIEKNRSFLTIP